MQITIEHPLDIKELASFLAEMNVLPQNHVGYCGEQAEETADALMNDFSDAGWRPSFLCAYANGKVIGAVGFDIDLEKGEAEVWGPYVRKSDKDLAWQLLHDLSGQFAGRLNELHFFFHEDNQLLDELTSRSGGTAGSRHCILIANKADSMIGASHDISPYVPSDLDGFKKLHDELFPGTYYGAETILERLSPDRQLLVARSESGRLMGYVYVEALPKHGEGSIEYVAVAPDYRKQGIGTKLVQAGVKILFDHMDISEISLCVEKSNGAAISLYKAAGFCSKNDLIHRTVRLDGIGKNG